MKIGGIFYGFTRHSLAKCHQTSRRALADATVPMLYGISPD